MRNCDGRRWGRGCGGARRGATEESAAPRSRDWEGTPGGEERRRADWNKDVQCIIIYSTYTVGSISFLRLAGAFGVVEVGLCFCVLCSSAAAGPSPSSSLARSPPCRRPCRPTCLPLRANGRHPRFVQTCVGRWLIARCLLVLTFSSLRVASAGAGTCRPTNLRRMAWPLVQVALVGLALTLALARAQPLPAAADPATGIALGEAHHSDIDRAARLY